MRTSWSPPSKQKSTGDTPVWTYNYPTVNGEVQTNATQKFIYGSVNLQFNSPEHALNDFTRDYTINGMLFSKDTTSEKFRTAINEFVAKSPLYANNNEERQKIVDFLCSNGGQGNNFLVNDLISAQHVTLPGQFFAKSSNSQEKYVSNWSISKNGKIQFIYNADLLCIELDSPESHEDLIMLRNTDGGLIVVPMASAEHLRAMRGDASPLLNVNFTIELESADGVIYPAVKEIFVTGYTPQLQVQEAHFTNRHDKRTKMYLDILNALKNHMQTFKDDHIILRQLQICKRLIEESNFGQNSQPLELCCEYIKNINVKIKRLFGPDEIQKLGSILNEDSRFTSQFRETIGANYQHTNRDISQQLAEYGIREVGTINKGLVSEASQLAFGSILLNLNQHLAQFKTASKQQYSADDLDPALTQAVSADISSSMDAQLVNTQPFRIEQSTFEISSSKNHVDGAIHELLRKVSPALKKTYNSWLQDNIRLRFPKTIDLLFDHGVIFAKGIEPGKLKPNSTLSDAVWSVNLNGELELTCLHTVSSLQFDNKPVIRNPANNELLKVKSLGNKYANDTHCPPIALIETKYILKIEDGKVTPVLKSVNIDSFTNDLTLQQTAVHRNRYAPK